MKHTRRKAGFSLMEINMAVFVMAVGILGMITLFPLGLNEGVQGRADLKQSMFADHALNQVTALLSSTNVYWTKWIDLNHTCWPERVEIGQAEYPLADLSNLGGGLDAEQELSKLLDGWKIGGENMTKKHYRVFFDLTDGPSSKVMGIGVRSTETDKTKYQLYTNNPLYYAEVLFQGDPMR
jgi:hypothetical protein